HLTNGAHSYAHAKIGHQGVADYGQSGGNFIRSEHFYADGVQSTIITTLTAAGARVQYSEYLGSAVGRGVAGIRDFSGTGAGTLVGDAFNTADILVNAGGSVTLDHLALGQRQPQERLDWLGITLPHTSYVPDNQAQGIRTRNSYA